MPSLQEATDAFLAEKRIAVVGVSRDSGEAANLIYRKLRDSGYQVFPINPKAQELEGDRCYPTLASIPGGVGAGVIVTPPSAARQVVEDCAAAGIRRIWMHRSFGKGSVSDEAVELGREKGLSVIPGACPMMFLEPVDVGHRCIRWFLCLTGGLPRPSAGGTGDRTAPAP